MPKRFLLAVTTQGRQLEPIGPFADDTQRFLSGAPAACTTTTQAASPSRGWTSTKMFLR